jgi:hypothetical protein
VEQTAFQPGIEIIKEMKRKKEDKLEKHKKELNRF